MVAIDYRRTGEPLGLEPFNAEVHAANLGAIERVLL